MRNSCLVFLILSNILVLAQPNPIDTVEIDEITITTQRFLKEDIGVPYSVGVLKKREMVHFTRRSTPEMLLNSNGVFIQKTNHGGGSPFIRGLTGNQTLLLFDGIRLNNSVYRYGPNQYLNTVDVFSIDRIEVARGTGSVQYGSDALGGAIQLVGFEPVLKNGIPEWKRFITGKIVSGGMEQTGRGQLEYSSEKAAFYIGGTFRNFGDVKGGKNTGLQTPSGYDEYAFDGKLVFALTDNVQLTLASYFLNQSHVPVYHKVALENYRVHEFHPQQRFMNYARISVQNKGRVFNRVKFISSWQSNVENTVIQKNNSNFVQYDFNKVNTFGNVAEFTSVLSTNWKANTGIELYNDRVASSRLFSSEGIVNSQQESRGLYPDDSQFTSFSMYSVHYFVFNNWVFDGGLRFNSFQIKIKDKNLGEVSLLPRAFVFNTGVMYNLNRANRLYGNISNGFRAPNIDDLGSLGIVDFRYEVPAYDLKPEKSVNLEVGYKLGFPKFQSTFAYYRLGLKQLINRVKTDGEFIDGYPVYKKVNVGKAFIKGCESAFLVKVFPKFDVSGSFTYTYGHNKTVNEPMRRIPPFFGKLNSTYVVNKFFVSGEWLFAGKQIRLAEGDKNDNRIPEGGTPGWNLINFFAGYQFSIVNLTFGLENIFNEDYRTHGSGINGAGRNAWIKVGFTF